MSAIDDVALDACVSHEMSHWCRRGIRAAEAGAQLDWFNKTVPYLFLVDLDENGARLVEKPGGPDEFLQSRAKLYEEFLASAMRTERPDVRLTIALDVSDQSGPHEAVPVFRFQKPMGSADILLPDIDLLTQQWFEDETIFGDDVAYDDKAPRAFFAGSTTGGGMLTEESAGSLPRVRSARFFAQRSSLVDFRIPNIVQCATRGAEAALRAYGAGGRCTAWRESNGYRFLISMDGNGATCSRVALALRGQGVLLKYKSEHQLFYFHALKTGRHFLSIETDRDVLDIVRREIANPGAFRSIADGGRAFAQAVLTREASYYYTARLIRAYVGCMRS